MADEIDVEIANLATGFFGEDDQIRSPDDDSKPARSVRAAWVKTRQFVLSKTDWSFASRYSRLSARPDTNAEYPVLGYAYAYPLPARFVRLVRIVEPEGARDDYAIRRGPSGREIFTDYAGPLEIEWIEDVEEVARWSVEFVEAFTMRLAWHVADRLSGDKQRKQQAYDAYREALSSGRNSDARQKPPRAHAQGDWSRGRRDVQLRAPNT